MKFVRTDAEIECPLIDAALRERGELVLLPDGVTEDRLVDEIAEADLLLMCYAPITARVIGAARNLKGIVKYGVGIDAIDIPAASARGIPVVNVPEYADETVAEGAFAMMIALAKRLKPIGAAMDRQGWIWPEAKWLASDLAGKTLGIVGAGRIGRSMARMAGAGFRMRVLAYDPTKSVDDLAAHGIEKCDDLGKMLEVSDVVSLHASLSPRSEGVIGQAEIARMKPGSILINSARGALVDEAALVDALLGGHLGGAGLDVFCNEPLDRQDHPLAPLYDLDNVILSPHLTFFTREAMERLEQDTLDRCNEILAGKPVTVKSRDPRLRAQTSGVVFPDLAASGT